MPFLVIANNQDPDLVQIDPEIICDACPHVFEEEGVGDYTLTSVTVAQAREAGVTTCFYCNAPLAPTRVQ